MFLYLVSVLLIALYFLKKHLFGLNAGKDHGNKIPGPKPLPIIGNTFDFGFSLKSAFKHLQRHIREFGPIYQVQFGPRTVTILAAPDYVQPLLGTMKHIDKATVYHLAEAFGGQGLVLITGETWKLHRKIIGPTLAGHHLIQFLDVFNSNLDVLIEKLSQHQDGPSFDIFPIMSLYTLDVICESAMGVKLNFMLNQDSEYLKAVTCLEDILFKRLFRPWLWSDIIFNMTSLGRLQARCLPILMGLAQKIIQERKKEMSAASNPKTNNETKNEDLDIDISKKRAFLDSILREVEQGANLSEREIVDEVNTIMAAGHDTTAATLSYVCWLLAKHQDVQDKVVEELRSIFGDSLRDTTTQDLNELKYLDQVIKESLRLYPAAPFIGRRINEELIIDKYVLPPGSEIGINVYMLHRHSEHFPDPERFDPDRFLPENCANRHPYAYIPFSGGPRNCVGYKFAMHEMKATMSKLLRHFKILPPENPFQELDLTLHVVLKSTNGVPIRLQPRNF